MKLDTSHSSVLTTKRDNSVPTIPVTQKVKNTIDKKSNLSFCFSQSKDVHCWP